MGLDMYAFTVPQEWAGDKEVDYQPDADRAHLGSHNEGGRGR